MKHKLNQTEKTRRQAWRDAIYQAPRSAPVRMEPMEPGINTLKEPRTLLADAYKGTTYRPKVR